MPKVKITGLDELKKDLKKLSEKTRKSIVVSSLRSGAVTFRQSARSLAPAKSGILKKAITVKKIRTKDRSIVKFITAWTQQRGGKNAVAQGSGTRNDAYYGHFVEYGTVHQSAQPFIRPAYDIDKSSVTGAITKQMAKRITKEANK